MLRPLLETSKPAALYLHIFLFFSVSHSVSPQKMSPFCSCGPKADGRLSNTCPTQLFKSLDVKLLCGSNEQHPAAGPTPASRKMLLPWPASTDILPSSPKTFPLTLRKLGFFTLDTTLPRDANTCTSPCRNVVGTQKSGELMQRLMPNQAADAAQLR